MKIEKFGKGKTILLAAPHDMSLHKEFEKNLQFYGFHVIKASIELDSYPSLWERIKVKTKQILGNKNAKKLLFKKILHKHIVEKLSSYTKIDYSLCITAQRYNKETIEFIRSKTTSLLINYQYDGMSRYPDIYHFINLFDRFYVFDPQDVNNNLLFTTNFFFDYNLNQLINQNIIYDLYNLSNHIQDRKDIINAMANYAKENNLSINFKIRCHPNKYKKIRKEYLENIEIITSLLTFKENLEQMAKAKVLVDFVINEHNGLSFRVFEALGYRKKLITTNKTIKNYDFYHPNNIFILDNNVDELNSFLQSEYIELDEDIRQKYSFYNWIKYILDIEEYTSINLPKK